jgi:hypothetical protein
MQNNQMPRLTLIVFALLFLISTVKLTASPEGALVLEIGNA